MKKLKTLICITLSCLFLTGCGDGFNEMKIRNHINETRPDEICVNAPFGNSYLQSYGFICRDKKGVVSYVFYGTDELKVSMETVLIK